MDYNDYSDIDVAYAWLECGYKPSLGSTGRAGTNGAAALTPAPTATAPPILDGRHRPRQRPLLRLKAPVGRGRRRLVARGHQPHRTRQLRRPHAVINDLDDSDVLLPLYDVSTDLGADFTFHIQAPASSTSRTLSWTATSRTPAPAEASTPSGTSRASSHAKRGRRFLRHARRPPPQLPARGLPGALA